MKKKLENLGIAVLNEKTSSIDKSIIENIESKRKIGLPKDYKDFLDAYGRTMIFNNEIRYKPLEISPWTMKNGYASLELFYGLENDDYNLNNMIQRYEGRIPDSLIPIAEAPGGNVICIGAKKDEFFGKLYFWDHEGRGKKKNDLYLIANSFKDFIDSLENDV